jgi:hypothetical protein
MHEIITLTLHTSGNWPIWIRLNWNVSYRINRKGNSLEIMGNYLILSAFYTQNPYLLSAVFVDNQSWKYYSSHKEISQFKLINLGLIYGFHMGMGIQICIYWSQILYLKSSQYLVWPPFASCSATHLFHVE